MLGFLAGLLPGVASAVGQERANRQNVQLAREQMGFQERMSNTAYQRATADMRMAGINPMLAYMQGGASSPGGSAPTVADAVGPAVSSAMHGMQLRAELKARRQELQNQRQTNRLLVQQTAKTENEANLAHENWLGQQYVNKEMRTLQQANLRAQTRATNAAAALDEAGAPRARFEGGTGGMIMDYILRALGVTPQFTRKPAQLVLPRRK